MTLVPERYEGSPSTLLLLPPVLTNFVQFVISVVIYVIDKKTFATVGASPDFFYTLLLKTRCPHDDDDDDIHIHKGSRSLMHRIHLFSL